MARDHERYAEDVAPYVLGALAPLEAEALEKHMRGCADCQRELAELRSGVEVLSRSVEQVEPPASLRDRALWLAHDGTQVHLLFAEHPVAAPEGHLAVVLDDYGGVLETLKRAGHDPEPRREHWGSPRAFVRDPAGHRVELMAAPPPSG